MAIISPVPVGLENLYPHVLTNVLFHREPEVKLTPSVNEYLKLPSRLTDFAVGFPDMGKHVHHAVPHQSRSRPRPERRAPWRITPCRRLHLGIWHRTSGKVQVPCGAFLSVVLCQIQIHNLTPYMCKLIDYGLLFMKKLPVPIVRFQAEAGEHANYLHSTFYYAHTTDMDEREIVTLCYRHSRPHGAAVSGGHCRRCETASHFQNWLAKHRAAVTLQRMWRGSWPGADCGWVVLEHKL